MAKRFSIPFRMASTCWRTDGRAGIRRVHVAVPTRCVDDPPDRRLEQLHLRETLRGAGPRDIAVIQDAWTIWAWNGRSVTDARDSAARGGGQSRRVGDLRRCLRSTPADQLGGPPGQLQNRAVEDEPAPQGDDRAARRCIRRRGSRRRGLPSIAQTTIGDIQTHFANHYRPNGTILGVAGQFEWESLKDTVGQLLGDWQPGPRPAIVEQPTTMKYAHIPYESSQTQIGIAYTSVPYRHPDYYQAWAGVGVLSGGMSARLFTEVRERARSASTRLPHVRVSRRVLLCRHHAGGRKDARRDGRRTDPPGQRIEPHGLMRLRRIKSA